MTRDRYRIGFDIGGTFTDFVLSDARSGDIRLYKCLTTPEDPSIGALEGLNAITQDAGLTLSDIGEIVHGTTLVTNAVIERKGARLGLITTQGFGDLLEMGTEQRYDIYDLFLTYPEPFVERRNRLEVTERIDRDGSIVTDLDESEVRRAARSLRERGVEAVAICFLHSYRNPAHEQAAARIVREEMPEAAVSVSSEVVAELWEYQRCVTTCANAYVQPLMNGYLTRLEHELDQRGFSGTLRLMHSAGGLVSPATARAFPIRLLESGPAGGALATALFGERAGKKDVIAFDMGGTTAKACLIEDGRAEIAPMLEAGRVHRFKKGSGLPIKAPVIDMIEIGAGGGSIAAIDEVGLLRVGPHSAGADPGPACYGRGGTKPTVTDANLVLGYYDPGFFLGGKMSLDKSAAEDAMRSVADPLGLSAAEAAWGIHKVVVESMADAARVYLVEKGKDPRNYAMVGFGGAGPAHAAEVARTLGVRELIIPPASGAASALGFLVAPLSFEQVRSLPVRLSEGLDAVALNRTLDELESHGRELLAEAGISGAAVTVERSADMRLVGQMHEITVPLPGGRIDEASLPEIHAAFAKAYTARYTSLYPGAQVEAVNFRVRCTGPAPDLQVRDATGDAQGRKQKGTRQACFGDGAGFVDAAVYDRYALASGDRIAGPAIIEEREATTIVPPGDHVTVDEVGNLRIAIAEVSARDAVVTSEMSLEDAIRQIEADPIALEIMWSRLITVVDEMWLTIVRTAFSLIIAESQDFACELLDPTGETLAHSPRAMPVFNLTLPRAVKALLEKFPAETLQPGDVLVTNDPWLCAGHLFDIAVVTPAFKDGRLVGLMGTVGHVADIGGTKASLSAREIYEEGLQIPPMKLFKAGQPSEDLFALIGENVRNSAQVIGDIHAFVAANALGAERLVAFMDEYGMQDLKALAAVVQGRSEKAMRDAIRALPDGIYTSEISNNPLGEPMRFPLKLTVSGDTVELDFEGAPPQVAQGGFNSTLNYTAAHATYPLKCMLTPGVRGNAGCYRAFTVKAPEGSILNCRKPAAVNLRTRTGWYIAPNVFRALAEAAPDKVQAATGLPVATSIYGYDPSGRLYADHLFVGGGQGGSDRGDGKSGLMWPTSAANTSIELFESRVPVLVLEKAYLPNSGGPGRHRGGLGQRVRFRKLEDDGQTTLVSIYPEGVKVVLPGPFRGRPGGAASGAVRTLDGKLLKDCGTGDLVSLTSTEEVAEVVLAGGAGFGDPLERALDKVADDLANGYVTARAAAHDYGVVVSGDGRIEEAATAETRRRLHAEDREGLAPKQDERRAPAPLDTAAYAS
ncbi:hydantoinase B/oxoprolinase family protein [Microvirga lotononidis]|uniref:N-methylhydantoinase A/acetone carboxylase, beta subunit n=1 Tax=Microvirga lotononidis TaxID=864069 RepID=I4Z3H7_9HYPH|nr:hydantoinase B/oxoprolinase family protein [Microvirga lotononidis]EIM30769.1 N-methylhydantoinase A/acetone carboxylase, beta subunit [Microvirga lotononidis]WQO31723.1 hydantoinase B/oxoprolinase family protein [Microvirga lotononidis]